jgi:hypothetical protein
MPGIGHPVLVSADPDYWTAGQPLMLHQMRMHQPVKDLVAKRVA